MAFGVKPKAERSEDSQKFYTTTMTLENARRFLLLKNVESDDPSEPVEIPIKSYAIWLPVRVGENTTKRRIFLDWEGKQLLPAHLQTKVLSRMFMNVYDLTNVIEVDVDPDNSQHVVLSYMNKEGVFVTGFGKNERIVQGKPSPNKRIMILEAPKVMTSDLEGQLGMTFSMEGEPINSLLELQFTAKMIIDQATNKQKPLVQSSPLPERNPAIDLLPRYDTSVFKPWPIDALQALLDGEDFEVVTEQYSIRRVPRLVSVEEPAF